MVMIYINVGFLSMRVGSCSSCRCRWGLSRAAVAVKLVGSHSSSAEVQGTQHGRQPCSSVPAGKGSIEVRRMFTRFNAWLRKYISKHCPLEEEGANILDRLSRV